ncbi:MAG: cytochrome P450 [Benniella sp.]|nr:MAG: cytochrome P450 [Benniella sp.]
MISNAFFHPLSPIPGNKLLASTYFFTSASSLTGRTHYSLPLYHRLYGKVVRIAPEIVSVADKDMIREILVTTDYPKSYIHEGFELNDQHNLFSSRNKDFHKNRRRLVAPAFGLQYLRSLEPIMQECIQILVRKIDEVLEDPKAVKGKKVLPKGQINICSFMMRLSLDIIGETAFGQSFDMVENDTHPVPHQMAKTLKRCMQQAFNPWMKWVFKVDYSFADFGAERVKDRKSKGEKGRRADLLQYLIDAQANERANGNGETGNEYEDMISGKLTDKAVETEAIVFLIAGSETSSTAITFTLMYLVKNPDKLAKLREELDLATASNPYGVLPTYEQVRNLPYLTGCIHESLRLRPVAATGLPREVTEDVTMNGHFFPKGTILLAQLPQLHWSDEYFPQADKFIPERWIPEESPFPPMQDFTFYPFSAGTRNCIGKNFAMMEMRLILATIITMYDIGFVPNQREDYIQFITTALATESYVITMKKRQPFAAVSV